MKAISPLYYLAKNQLEGIQFLKEGKITSQGHDLVQCFFEHIDISRYRRQANLVLPEQHTLDDLLYVTCLLLWHDQRVEQKQDIRSWAGQYQLHPAVVPIAGAVYISEQKPKKMNVHEPTASYALA